MNKEKRKSRTRSVIAVSFVTGAVCLFILALVFHNFVFVIENIRVENNLHSNSDDIIASSNIVLGEPMYSINKKEIYEAVKKSDAYIESVSIKRDLPSVVRIIVTESEPSSYAVIAGEYFILSDGMRVLEYTDDADYAKETAPYRIILPKVIRMIVGDELEFEGSSDNSYISAVTEAIGASKLSDRVEIISVKNKFGIYAVCDGLYRIELGSSEDAELKLEVAYAIIESGKLEAGIPSIIDVSNPAEGSVISDKTLVLVPDA